MWKFVIVAAVLTGLASGQSSEPEAKGFRLGGPSESAVIEKVEPAYTQDARIEGVVILSLVIDESGAPTTIVVRRSLGYGLNQKAIEALEQWGFRPAMENGRPAKRAANVEMNFRLLADELPKATPEQLKDAAKLREQLEPASLDRKSSRYVTQLDIKMYCYLASRCAYHFDARSRHCQAD